MRSRAMVVGAVAIAGLALGACSSDSRGEGGWGGEYEGNASPAGADDGGVIEGDGSASAHPIKAIIDPNASMLQSPGQGVGVFTQYDTGGHWYVWWTCDTNLSGDSCPFNIQISAVGGIENATTQGFREKDSLVQTGAAEGGDAGVLASITAETLTTTTVQGVEFDTDPGAVITLSATLGGEYSGSFLFFVQDHLVNGGYKGVISDPLELEPSSP